MAPYSAATARNLNRLKGASFRSNRNATRMIDRLIPNDQSPALRGVIQDREETNWIALTTTAAVIVSDRPLI
jgi:hypothetical protein